MRLIPRLDIKGPNLVKGVHLEGLRVLGKPERFAREYYRGGADELLYIDAVASLYGRNSLLDIVSRTSQEIFVPLTVGGGLRSVEDIRQVLRAGADKVAINSAAIRDPALIDRAAQRFGSSTIVISIQAKKRADGTYEAYVDGGRERTDMDAVAWAGEAAARGAGELMITSVDREGTGKGFDLDLTRGISDTVGVPVIACGGARTPADVVTVVREGHADAVSVASILHYYIVARAGLEGEFDEEGNTDFVRSGRSFSRIEGAALSEIKDALVNSDIACRPASATHAEG